jgi:hypothetical protein
VETEPAVVALTTLAAAYGMVVLGMARRRLVWRRKCRVCGGPRDLCRCRYPRY